jgi:hypothetical protein
MAPRNLHIVHLLIREQLSEDEVGFLVFPHERWKDGSGKPFLALPAKKTVSDPLAEFIQGTPLDGYIDQIMKEELRLLPDSYALAQELRASHVRIASPTHADGQGQGIMTHYTVYPIDVWVRRSRGAKPSSRPTTRPIRRTAPSPSPRGPSSGRSLPWPVWTRWPSSG